MAAPTVSFNGSDFASSVAGLIVVATNPYRTPNRKLNINKIANTDKSAISSSFYDDKKLNVTVEIGLNTRGLLDAAIDTLNTILQPQDAALVITSGSSTRQWTATFANMATSDVKGGHAMVDIEFECADPIGTDVNSTTLFTTSLTGTPSTTNFTTAGSAAWQQPIITITLTALTGGASKDIVVGNVSTGQQVTINRTWVAADVLVIDSVAKTVKVNGVEVTFTGAIPEWATGAGQMSYSDTLTTRTRTMTATYRKRYV